jgi:hypothetical protein
MEPLTVSSAAAALLGLSAQVMSKTYRKWDDYSKPGVERLRCEVAELREALRKTEHAASLLNEPLILSDIPRTFEQTEAHLRAVLAALSDDIPGTSDPATMPLWELERFDTSRGRYRLPIKGIVVQDLVQDLFVCKLDLQRQ